MTDFQQSVNITQAPGTEGQRATMNPNAVLPGIEGAYRAGPDGVTVGRFAWRDTTSGYESLRLVNAGSGKPVAFIPNEFGESMITTYRAASGMVIPANFPVGNPITKGDYWVKNTGAGAVTAGMKAFAKLTDGTIIFDTAGDTNSGYIETDWYAATPGAADELIIMTTSPVNG